MESLGLYLLKSAVWLTGFALVFLMVLRNERYFRLNRIYLLSGIVAAIVFPFYTWHYAVVLPSVQVAFTTTSGVSAVAMALPPTTIPIYWWFYLAGLIGLVIRLIWQTGMVIRKLRKTGYVKTDSVKLVRTSEYDGSFSFFSYVFVNPSITDIETKEIVNHEREHIQQRHWFDLLLVELLCMLQWFNPFIWIYARMIRQNHEYLADEMALQHTSNPAIYQATLLNQMLGVPVISLANSFNYSLNKKRFKMMKKKIDSPFRKLRMLLVLPLVAMVFYAFAKPEYVSPTNPLSADNFTANIDGNDVKGKVVNADGKPLHGTSVILAGTTIGTIADVNGNFKLNSVPKDAKIAFSFVGFKTAMQKPDFNQPMTIKMVTDTVKFEEGVVAVGYSPLPALASKEGKDLNSLDNPPLYIVDGKIIDKVKFDKFNTADFESIDVLKDKSATDKYGEKGKYGVLEITMKKPHSGTTPGPIVDLKSIDSKNPPLYVVDGVITDKRRAEYFLEVGVESVSVLKGKTATDKYGEKGKYGVLEITLKKVPAVSSEKKSVDVIPKSDVAVNSKSQQTKEGIFVVVEEMPEFPGGEQACKNFIARTLKYPIKAMNSGKTGKVYVTFIVNKNGKVENAKVIRGIDPALDKEVIRVVNSLPDWKPGMQRGKAVDVVYTMPIEFMLQ